MIKVELFAHIYMMMLLLLLLFMSSASRTETYIAAALCLFMTMLGRGWLTGFRMRDKWK
jgi:hypothetical protein